jgi:hypothetical protein
MKVLSHAHTTYSLDGELTPQALADVARSRGFDAVLVSDHFEHLNEHSFRLLVEDCRAATRCLLVPGYVRDWDGFHVLALGVDQWFDHATIEPWADAVRGAGGMVVAAHPGRYGHDVPERILAACDGVEVWNSKRGYDGPVGPHPRAYALLGDGRLALCGQDVHGVRHATSVGLEMTGANPSRSIILQSLREGRFAMRNSVWAFDGGLSFPARAFLHLFHAGRTRALTTAIRIVRIARRARRGGKR